MSLVHLNNVVGASQKPADAHVLLVHLNNQQMHMCLVHLNNVIGAF